MRWSAASSASTPARKKSSPPPTATHAPLNRFPDLPISRSPDLPISRFPDRRLPDYPITRLPDLLEPLVHRVPVDDVPPCGQVVGAAVLVLQVVRVLPHVDAEDRLLAFHQRAVLVGGALDHQLPAGVDQPRPAAAEALGAGVVHLRLELVEVAE